MQFSKSQYARPRAFPPKKPLGGMRRTLTVLALTLGIAGCAAGPNEIEAVQDERTPRTSNGSYFVGALNCYFGPVKQVLGGAEWLAYSCDDRRSLTFMTPDENTETSFIITVRRDGKTRGISGVGLVSKSYYSATFKEIRSMTDSVLDQLVETTRAVGMREEGKVR